MRDHSAADGSHGGVGEGAMVGVGVGVGDESRQGAPPRESTTNGRAGGEAWREGKQGRPPKKGCWTKGVIVKGERDVVFAAD